uniref:Uncharacterized protein AlNc14C89G5641 n=1 Tax=Albugo laibachii Nc14 TaxID=890382 RepID=F0WGB1_9STRA|nr:conserved hypothetical protein [Albugo laibachii Nc14]|eukprot:CCA20246.1 conserved hypothetical protein [Albugo laibachii Nc14]
MKENMNSFIQKKRDVFLVQMSLDTKREEIRKLEEKARVKEIALQKSESMLEEDALQFDSFLKENDRKAHDAIKRAEKETKAKTDKLFEIKNLNHQIQGVESEVSKLNEQLQDCLQYKAFLDDLTPVEYVEEQLTKLKELCMDQSKKKKRDVTDEGMECSFECQKISQDADRRNSFNTYALRKGTMEYIMDTSNSSNLIQYKCSIYDDAVPLYFRRPQQLLDIFTALEESNLFLIKNSQETEQTLDELKQNFLKTKNMMDRRSQILNQSINELQAQIEIEEKRTEQFCVRSSKGSAEETQEKVLMDLHDHVLDVYKRCGFDAESNLSTIYMLTELEARIEELLRAIEKMPEEYVIKVEKEKEKERRERVRQERITQQQRLYEERMKKSMERSMKAPKKRKGRQQMWRSHIARQILQTEKEDLKDKGNESDQQFFVW